MTTHRKVLDDGARTGVVEEMIVEEDEGVIHLNNRTAPWAVKQILDNNRRLAGERQTCGDAKHAGSIPIAMWQDWRNAWMGKKYGQRGRPPKEYMGWRDYLRVRLNERNFAGVRIWDGKV